MPLLWIGNNRRHRLLNEWTRERSCWATKWKIADFAFIGISFIIQQHLNDSQVTASGQLRRGDGCATSNEHQARGVYIQQSSFSLHHSWWTRTVGLDLRCPSEKQNSFNHAFHSRCSHINKTHLFPSMDSAAATINSTGCMSQGNSTQLLPE